MAEVELFAKFDLIYGGIREFTCVIMRPRCVCTDVYCVKSTARFPGYRACCARKRACTVTRNEVEKIATAL